MKTCVEVNTIENQVYAIVLEKIRTRVYPPGFHLNEAAIAEELGASRSPVREAIKRLGGSDLIEIIPNKGAFVKAFTKKELENILEAREMIELFAVQNVKYPLTPEQQASFIHYRDDFCSSLEDQDQFLMLDLAFHAEIVALLDNPYILNEYRELNWRINYVRGDTKRVREHLERICSDHLKMIDMLLKSDIDGLVPVLKRHLAVCSIPVTDAAEL